MKGSRASVLVAALLVVVEAASAHEAGPAHHAGPAAAVAETVERPRRLGPDRLFVPKSVQHQLGLRTRLADVHATTVPLLRLGEVAAHPDAPGSVTAPESGRLERAEPGRWPVAGQTVRAGQALAVLVPSMSERERAQRRAALAVIEQKLEVARVNARRMRLQADARGGAPAADNVYLEQAEAELSTQERIAALAREGLQGRVLLRAPAAGVLGAARVQPGATVAAGDRLFEIGGGGRTRVTVDLYDPRAAGRIVRARLVGERLPVELEVRGVEPHPSRPGWRVLLDAPARGDESLMPGTLVDVQLEIASDPAPSAGCPPSDASPPIWVHAEPEVFERRAGGCAALALAPADRVVVRGAALLDEYR